MTIISHAMFRMIAHAFVLGLLLETVAISVAEAGWTQWTSGEAPFHGPVWALAIDPTMPGTVYGTVARPVGEYGGIVKSTDGGAHWRATNCGLTADFVYALAVDPQTPTTVYAGTSGWDGAWGVFKSTDGGAHWNATNTGYPPPTSGFIETVQALIVDPQTHATVYAGTSVGVFKSWDEGGTWSAASSGLSDTFVFALAIDPGTPTTLYVATSAGVFKTMDGGSQWSDSSVGLPSPPIIWPPLPGLISGAIFSLVVDPQTPSTIYAGTVDGVYKSTDGGAHWWATNVGPGDVHAVAVDPQIPTTVYASTYGWGVFKSTDGGQNWTQLNAGLGSSELFFGPALQVSPSGACLHAGTEGDIFDFVTGPDPCAPPVSLMASVNRSSIEEGETLEVSVGAMSPGASETADFYLGFLLPDASSIAFLTSATSFALGTATDPASFRPIAVGVPLDAPLSVTVPNFFSYEWTGSEPRGTYLFFLFATPTGALTDGMVTGDEILGLATATFTFP